MISQPDLFIVMVDYGDGAPQGIVDQNDTWSDALGKVKEAWSAGHKVVSLTHIHDGTAENRLLEACEVLNVEPARDETEQRIVDWLRDHNRDERKHWVAA
jgi:hypothetical protein